MHAAKRYFLSGPMDGVRGFNHDAFHAAAAKWRKKADAVWNPAELFDGAKDRRRVDYQRANLAELTRTSGGGSYYDGLLLLPGWQRSPGALLEIQIANELHMDIIDAHSGEEVKAARQVRAATSA